MVIPFNWTLHTNKFIVDGWLLGNSIRMGYDTEGIFIDLIFEKPKPPLRTEGDVEGMDRGSNVMLESRTDSELAQG
jgi:hypothetical protein